MSVNSVTQDLTSENKKAGSPKPANPVRSVPSQNVHRFLSRHYIADLSCAGVSPGQTARQRDPACGRTHATRSRGVQVRSPVYKNWTYSDSQDKYLFFKTN